jgi:hypothetical protein
MVLLNFIVLLLNRWIGRPCGALFSTPNQLLEIEKMKTRMKRKETQKMTTETHIPNKGKTNEEL